MRLIKLAILSFLFLFLLVTGFSLFIPSTVRISRATSIMASKDVVMQQVAEPVNWKNWFPLEDPTKPLYVNGEVKGIIMDTVKQRGLLMLGRNDTAVWAVNAGRDVRNISSGWSIHAGSGPADVTVQWWMDFKLRWYPWEKFASLLFEKQYGTHMEEGLNRLKNFTENK
ncbi:MAG TPA: hypothetical protein VFZ42_03120 [Chitinophagaceae bacterium]